MKVNKDLLMKIGIVAAIAIIIYLVYKSRSCKSSFSEYVPTPEEDYAENMYEEEPADFADYAEEGDEYVEDQYPDYQENYTLMESTLDDDQANAVFQPDM